MRTWARFARSRSNAVAAAAFALVLASFAQGASPAVGTAARVSPELFEKAVRDHVTDVNELKLIRQEAKRLGVRAWLFGGTASAFGHYLRWDLARQAGGSSGQAFQADRFDYDYTNIFRANQDLDIVIDGTPEQAEELQALLEKKFPYFLGSKKDKSTWEVRLLSQGKGTKEALLKNPDFLNQHTDSNSTGMIEITAPSRGEHAVRDLRDWDAADSHFARDLREGRITYYFSPEHVKTARFREGLNPPILSAIRYLTKVVQYELEPREEDMKVVRGIIRDFDPAKPMEPYVRTWLEKNGIKLFANAVNLEYAWNLVDGVGLRKKLLRLDGDPLKDGSLAWWMNKEPLRSMPVGRGRGKTAAALGITHVTHDTRSFSNYELIVMSKKGEPNFLISRDGGNGEAAVHGDGLYTFRGKQSNWADGFNIRMELDPAAREGTDFILPTDKMVLIRNKRAVHVVPESLSVTPVSWFQMLRDGFVFQSGDNGIYEKLQRRIEHRGRNLTSEEDAKISRIVAAELDSKEPNRQVLNAFAQLPEPLKILRPLTALERVKVALAVAELSPDGAANLEKALSDLMELDPKEAARYVRSAFRSRPHPELVMSWARLWSGDPHFSWKDWVNFLADPAHLQGQHGLADYLKEALSQVRISKVDKATLGQYVKDAFLASREPRTDLLKVWTALDAKAGIWKLSDWADVLARGGALDPDDKRWVYFARDQIERLQKLSESASEAEVATTVKRVAEMLESDDFNPFFPELWLSTPLAAKDPGPLVRHFLDHMGEIDPKQLVAKSYPIEGIIDPFIQSLPKDELVRFQHAIIPYRDEILFPEAKRKFVIPIFKRKYELGKSSPAEMGGARHLFRTPWTWTWNSTLRELIDLMASQRDTEGLAELANLGSFPEAGIAAFEPEFRYLIRTAGVLVDRKVPKAREVLRSIAEAVFSHGDEKGRDYGRALSALIAEAVRVNDPETLVAIAEHAFRKPATDGWMKQADELIVAAEKLGKPEVLGELAGHYQSGKGEQKSALYSRLIKVARETKNPAILERMAWGLSYRNNNLSEGVQLELIAAVRELRAKGALAQLPQNLFYGYEPETVPSLNVLRAGLGAAHDVGGDALHNFSFWTFGASSNAVKEKYYPAYPEFIARLLSLGTGNQRQRAEFAKFLKREGTPRLDNPEAIALWKLLHSADPGAAQAKVEKEYPDCAGGFKRLAAGRRGGR